MRTQIYKDKKESMNYNACSKDMTELKKSLDWLKEVDSTALQSALKFLDTAYQNFFRRLQKDFACWHKLNFYGRAGHAQTDTLRETM